MNLDKNIDNLISNLNLNEHQQQNQIIYKQIINNVNKTPTQPQHIIPKCPNAPRKQKYSNKNYRKMKPRILFLDDNEFHQYNQNISPLIKFKPLNPNLNNNSNNNNFVNHNNSGNISNSNFYNITDGSMTLCIPSINSSNNTLLSSPTLRSSQNHQQFQNVNSSSPKSSPTLSSSSPTSKINLSLSLRV